MILYYNFILERTHLVIINTRVFILTYIYIFNLILLNNYFYIIFLVILTFNIIIKYTCLIIKHEGAI